ncbi:DENN domain-containing protein 10 [Pseudoliparis swirei]|uniref:DENN domain-containing protein 10 n=1 Tax=Pseudoliparis swirei TaxID=2059687 RepID=UPI0024BDBBFF|nr:DENN domain-containing protein 10 [Pseudoliparis swirei]
MLSVGLIEKDVNGDALWVWCFPSVDSDLRRVLLSKSCLTQDGRDLHAFVFGQFRRTWYYVTTAEVQEPTALTKVTHFSIVVTAKDFNPEKYAALSRVLCRMYSIHGSPVEMMEAYVTVLTQGVCHSDENGSFLIQDYDVRKAYLAGSVKDVVSRFGMETVVLYTALMLKKRIVVHHPRIEALLEFTRALPTLTWHRKDWSVLHPFVHLAHAELEDLKKCPGYVAGFIDPEVSNRSDVFDVYVNLPDGVITVSQSAKESMSMGKLHKDVGLLIVQSAEDDERSETQVIKDISVKTREILDSLVALAEPCGDSKLTLQALQQHRLPPATESFLFHLAAAEQLLRV